MWRGIAAVVTVALIAGAVDGQPIVRELARKADRPVFHVSSVEIVLERTGCFGPCPAYTVRICGFDQSVQFRGNAFGEQGSVQRSISIEELYKLLDAFVAAQFFELPPEYDVTSYVFHTGGDEFAVLGKHTTDLPTTYLELRMGDRSKRLKLRANVPENLRQLADLVDSTVGTASLLDERRRPKQPD